MHIKRAGLFGFWLQSVCPWLRSTTPPFWFPSPNARLIQSGLLSVHEELRNLPVGNNLSFSSLHHLLSRSLPSSLFLYNFRLLYKIFLRLLSHSYQQRISLAIFLFGIETPVPQLYHWRVTSFVYCFIVRAIMPPNSRHFVRSSGFGCHLARRPSATTGIWQLSRCSSIILTDSPLQP
jgi:hypothetical protein